MDLQGRVGIDCCVGHYETLLSISAARNFIIPELLLGTFTLLVAEYIFFLSSHSLSPHIFFSLSFQLVKGRYGRSKYCTNRGPATTAVRSPITVTVLRGTIVNTMVGPMGYIKTYQVYISHLLLTMFGPINPFRTAVPFWGQFTQILRKLSPIATAVLKGTMVPRNSAQRYREKGVGSIRRLLPMTYVRSLKLPRGVRSIQKNWRSVVFGRES